jgi:nucleoside-diphosphate-sugar epimerase
MACISVGKVVQSLIHASQLPAEKLGPTRTVLLEGIPVTAQEMWNAVKDRAAGRVTFKPDPALQAIMDSVPKATRSARAAKFGFAPNTDIREIVREYEEAAVANHR